MSNVNVKLARQRIEENWDDIGACRSCGFHALLREHNLDDYEIENALNTDGMIELLCQNEDGGSDHRGIRFNLNELEHKYE
jgi:hypothetical protein